jgi:hypothetical protein
LLIALVMVLAQPSQAILGTFRVIVIVVTPVSL